MRSHAVLTGMLCLAGCASGTPQQSTMPTKEHSQSLEVFTRDIFAHMDQGDFEYIKRTACPDAVMFDLDDKGAPVAAWGKEAVLLTLDGYAKMAQAGTKVQSQIQRIQCEANAGVGFCAVEFDQTITANGQTMGPMKLRGTMTGMIYKDHWIWTSWHGSMREPPAAASAPAAAPAPTAQAPVQ